MRKAKLIIAALCIILAMMLSSCGEESRIAIKGVFYGDCGIAQEGYTNLYVVFDYTNDDTNRTLPETSDLVTVSVNDSNTYMATDNLEHKVTNGSGSYTYKDFDWIKRYCGYSYAVGYGDILGGSEPVRMFAHFSFNENDLSSGDEITLTVDDQTAKFPVSDAVKIEYEDEIMKVEENFEKAQILAAEKWRIDASYRVANFISRNSAYGFGDDFSGLSKSMKTLFSSESGGVAVNCEPESGFFPDTHTINRVAASLPAYDHDVIAEGYPDAIADIDVLEDAWNKLADGIVKSSISKNEMIDLLNNFEAAYKKVCDDLGMEYGPK